MALAAMAVPNAVMMTRLPSNRRIAQPGPPPEPRIVAVEGRGRLAETMLPAGLSLLDAVHQAVAGFGAESAVMSIAGGAFGPLSYVIPSLPPDATHAAFYSPTFAPAGGASLRDGCITFGWRDGAPFLHCHAFWTEADGQAHGGHILPAETVIAAPVPARIWLLDGLAFEQHPDPETNFTLFAPVPRTRTGDGTRCFGLRLRPNQDLYTTLEEFCIAHGIARARLHGGVASIIGADYEDGDQIESFATEMYLRNGVVQEGRALLDVALVDYTGRLSEGRLRRGANPVLMTVEIVIEALQG
jgi:predicted DNA-binding protein with PD1-like motif